MALVLADGTIEGFVGGVCSEHSVRAYALKALESGNAVLLRILPFSESGEGSPSDLGTSEDGAVVVQNPCLSGGVIEVFLEPYYPRRAYSWWHHANGRSRACDRRASSDWIP